MSHGNCHHGPEPGYPRAERGYCLICNLKTAFLAQLVARARFGWPPAWFEGAPSEEGLRAMAELVAAGLVRDEIDGKGRAVFVITRAGVEAVR